MIALISLIPWVLTVAALLFIIFQGKKQEPLVEDDEEDFFIDEEDREVVRVAVYDEKAYWVYDNVFYESDVTREPDFETARPIDVMSLPSKELNKLLVILDELQTENERD